MTDRIRDILIRVAAEDPTVADEVEQMGRDLIATADRLRAKGGDGWQSTGGMSDSVAVKVVAPDGSVRQSVDTGVSP